jgi:hypothetical protein
MSFFAVHSALNASSPESGQVVNSTTLKVIADYFSAGVLAQAIDANCSDLIQSLAGTSPLAFDFNFTSDPDLPRPAEVIQYYRASTAALALAGFDQNMVSGEGPSGQPSIPDWVGNEFVVCVNESIGQMIPLVDLNFSSSGGDNSAMSRVDMNAVGLMNVILLGLVFWRTIR